MYRCAQCGKDVVLNPAENLRCPYCGFKILFKTRQTVVKKVKSQ